MLQAVKDWVEGCVSGNYAYRYGQWLDDGYDGAICVITHDGGGRQSTVRYPNFRVVILGGKGSRGDSQFIINDALAVVEQSLVNAPCGFAYADVSEPIGPAFTTEGRAWVSVNLRLIK